MGVGKLECKQKQLSEHGHKLHALKEYVRYCSRNEKFILCRAETLGKYEILSFRGGISQLQMQISTFGRCRSVHNKKSNLSLPEKKKKNYLNQPMFLFPFLFFFPFFLSIFFCYSLNSIANNVSLNCP